MNIENSREIRVGSRKSELALIQTNYVISILEKLYPNNKYVIRTMTTVGDRVLNKSLPKIGEKSLFTKDLEEALTAGGVDFVVHSLKDLPTSLPVGMAIGAILKREDPRDALVLNEKYQGKTLNTLPHGAVIGTSSLRRSAQLARSYTHLTVSDIRGNLNTRLAKLDADKSNFDGIILAQAGLVRMGWEKRIDQVLEPEEILYAVGQGALAVECRSNDTVILDMLSSLCHLQTQCKILAERSFLKTLGGGCSAPVAVSTHLAQDHNVGDSTNFNLDIKGAVWSLDGAIHLEDSLQCVLDIKNTKESSVNYVDYELDYKVPTKKTKQETDVVDKVSHIEKAPISEGPNNLAPNTGKCPFEHKLQQNNKPNSTSNKDEGEPKDIVIECPLHLPIGQDVMGECPYVDVKHKVELANHFNRIRRISESGTSKSADEKETHNEDDNKIDAVTLKCPYSNNELVLADAVSTLQNINSSKHQLLILGKDKTMEYDIKENIHEKPTIVDNSATLYCGMYCHKHIDNALFDKCEQLGIKLANSLIEKGALKVMKCAQNEIREKL